VTEAVDAARPAIEEYAKQRGLFYYASPAIAHFRIRQAR
jgi:hypothetical protein